MPATSKNVTTQCTEAEANTLADNWEILATRLLKANDVQGWKEEQESLYGGLVSQSLHFILQADNISVQRLVSEAMARFPPETGVYRLCDYFVDIFNDGYIRGSDGIYRSNADFDKAKRRLAKFEKRRATTTVTTTVPTERPSESLVQETTEDRAPRSPGKKVKDKGMEKATGDVESRQVQEKVRVIKGDRGKKGEVELAARREAEKKKGEGKGKKAVEKQESKEPAGADSDTPVDPRKLAKVLVKGGGRMTTSGGTQKKRGVKSPSEVGDTDEEVPVVVKQKKGKQKAENYEEGVKAKAKRKVEMEVDDDVDEDEDDDEEDHDAAKAPLERAKERAEAKAEGMDVPPDCIDVEEKCGQCAKAKVKCLWTREAIRKAGPKACLRCRSRKIGCINTSFRGSAPVTLDLHTSIEDFIDSLSPPRSGSDGVPSAGVLGEDSNIPTTLGELLVELLSTVRATQEESQELRKEIRAVRGTLATMVAVDNMSHRGVMHAIEGLPADVHRLVTPTIKELPHLIMRGFKSITPPAPLPAIPPPLIRQEDVTAAPVTAAAGPRADPVAAHPPSPTRAPGIVSRSLPPTSSRGSSPLSSQPDPDDDNNLPTPAAPQGSVQGPPVEDEVEDETPRVPSVVANRTRHRTKEGSASGAAEKTPRPPKRKTPPMLEGQEDAAPGKKAKVAAKARSKKNN